MSIVASWTPSRPGRSVSKTIRVVGNYKNKPQKAVNSKKSSQKAVSVASATTKVDTRFEQQHAEWKQLLYAATEKRPTFSLGSFESAMDSEWDELLDRNRELAGAFFDSKKKSHTPNKSGVAGVAPVELVDPTASRAMPSSSTEIVSVVVAGVTTLLKAVGFVLTESMSSVITMGETDKNDLRLSKISRSGQGLFKLGKDLMDSSLSMVWKEFRDKTIKDPTPTGTHPATSSSATRATSYAAFQPASLFAASRPFPSHVYSATRPVSTLGTRPVNSLGTRPVARPTISLSPDEASQVWGYECDGARNSNGYPSGVDYMQRHWRTLQLVAVELLEDVRSYTTMAADETLQGIAQACDETIHAVTRFQSSVLKPNSKALPKYFFASTKAFPVSGTNGYFGCAAKSMDPKALFFVDLP
jgi:hypothetical protein